MRPTRLINLVVTLACPSMLAAQTVSGRVLDEPTRRPIAGASVVLLDAQEEVVSDTLTDDAGFFTLDAPVSGDYRIHVQTIGYSSYTASIHIPEAGVTIPAVTLDVDVVQLDSVRATAESKSEEAVVGFRRSSHVISGARMATLEQHGASPVTVVRSLPNLRMRRIPLFETESGRKIPDYQCIESTRRIMIMLPPRPECEPVVLVIDGIATGDPYDGLRVLNLNEIESIEMLSPVEAGFEYGMDASARGALVIWTRGRGPHQSTARDARVP